MLIDEDGRSLGVASLEQALLVAHSKGLDLVEVGPHAVPPVTKLVSWGKLKYQLKKKERRNKPKGGSVKEVKLSLKIGRHDLETKAKKAKEFLDEGHKVEVFLQLYGREQIFAHKAAELLKNFRDMIGGEFENEVERAGNRLTVMIVRKK